MGSLRTPHHPALTAWFKTGWRYRQYQLVARVSLCTNAELESRAMFISDLAVPHVARHPSAEMTSSYTARVNVPWIRERRRQARETGFHGRRPPPGRVGSPSVEGLLWLPPPHNTPAQLTLIQVANHSLLLQEVTAQLLVQAKGQHVVGERAAGETPVAITLLLAQKREPRHWGMAGAWGSIR